MILSELENSKRRENVNDSQQTVDEMWRCSVQETGYISKTTGKIKRGAIDSDSTERFASDDLLVRREPASQETGAGFYRGHPQNVKPDSSFHVFLRGAITLMLAWMELSSNSEEQLQDDLVLLHRVYPNLNRKQLLEAKENLDRYFNLAVREFLRLEREQNSSAVDTQSKNS